MSGIGNARMNADGTIVLDLIARGGGAVGHARKVYPPSHAEYTRILEHVGGLQPGEQKVVPPWPDPWDAARVEAAARAHARAKGWRDDAFTIEITATDAEGNACVVLERDAATRIEVRIDPDHYVVAREIVLRR